MFGSDRPGLEQPASAARRLSGLGLIPDRPGWVPDQPIVTGAQSPSIGDLPASGSLPPARVAAPALGDLLRDALAERLPPWAGAMVERVTLSGLAWTLAAVVAAIVAAGMYLHGRSSPASASYSPSSSYSSTSGSGSAGQPTDAPASPVATDPASIVVDVGGRVRKPGLVTLPPGARVQDAITAAGGPLHPRELARVDLAARVSDGQLLLVGVKGASDTGTTTGGTTDATGADPDGSPAPISLSDSTIEQLETLPGVGPVTAQKIIDWRTAHGGFNSIEELQQIPGIGPAHYAEISPLVTP